MVGVSTGVGVLSFLAIGFRYATSYSYISELCEALALVRKASPAWRARPRSCLDHDLLRCAWQMAARGARAQEATLDSSD